MYRLILLSLLLLPQISLAKSENDYVQKWCKGVTERRLYDQDTLVGRIDCETKYHAIEFDFAPKWSECLGQAIWYGARVNKISACALIIRTEKDCKHVKKISEAILGGNLQVRLLLVGEASQACQP